MPSKAWELESPIRKKCWMLTEPLKWALILTIQCQLHLVVLELLDGMDPVFKDGMVANG
jgi:hypothetical protein